MSRTTAEGEIGLTQQTQKPGTFSPLPHNQGLYSSDYERDACGFAMVATLRGSAGHDIVNYALDSLRNLEHRGAVGSDAGTGDGAGILTQIPDEFFRAVTDFTLPQVGFYAPGLVFLSEVYAKRAAVKYRIEALAAEEGLSVLGWREVPVNPEVLGDLARENMPAIEQLFVKSFDGTLSGIELDRLTFRLRKRIERELDVFVVSLSARTHVYKGMVTTLQLEDFYPDLSDERFTSKLALVHSRYSTNTFPSWPLAQPLRMIAHNGEINTVTGNRNWMRARESQLQSPLLGDLTPLLPICTPGASDSMSFDEVLELLVLGGRSLPHALMMMVPEAWENQDEIDPELLAFYEYHSLTMEPWDGPAAMAFSDGTLVGATLDRNGLRPGRYFVTDDGLVVLGSETGILPIDPARVVQRGRLQPGRMLLIDVEAGEIIDDRELKRELTQAAPWGEWLAEGRIRLSELPEREHLVHPPASISRRQRTFGYTQEEIRVLLAPMARTAQEPIAAMGSDTPIAVLSDRPRLMFDYFVQHFAQVTNPPLDSIREEVVTTLRSGLGPQRNLLSQGVDHAKQVILEFPVIDNDELSKIQHFGEDGTAQRTVTLRGLYRVDGGPDALRKRLDEMCQEAEDAIAFGAEFLILSDRDSTKDLAPIPSLLMVSAIHNHLIRQTTRMSVGLIVEAGDVREVHHVATLIGYGAFAINPYLAMETVESLVRAGLLEGIDETTAVKNLIKALGKGLLKIMSKMGVSALPSYAGAQAFEAVGLSKEVVDKYFTGTATRLGGIGIDVIAKENLMRHSSAYPEDKAPLAHQVLPTGGEYQWRRDGSPHLFNPETIFKLQHSTKTRTFEIFREYTKLVDDQALQLMTLRGMMSFSSSREPIPIDDVEPVSEIVKRFATGAMSYGSISKEAHETLAIAMNRIGGKSNTGEGGEDNERLLDPERRSAIKQVASGRFGVTSMYLTHADDIQIKLAQGAKPGEGGQLPPEKVYPWIAKTRHATPGVGLISPPPHHDIYSIEDLKQLIFDLKRSNPSARIHTKLVSQSGIGAVAAGVAKALSDVILVSGHDGGTGASPMNSLKHAGTPWELGLAETQHTLRLNNMRDRVVLQVDGQLKTGRDVVIAALLGAEEFGFATAPLVVSGCIMMRVCHLDTCPVGVATQNPVLRERFNGQADHVVNFFEFIAEEVRMYLAELGFRSIEEAVGHAEVLDVNRALQHWKASGLDLSPILHDPRAIEGELRNTTAQDHELNDHFDVQLIALSVGALERGEAASIEFPIHNTDRAVGTMLGHELTKRYAAEGLPEQTIRVKLSGTAGQSLGAFIPRGITLELAGDANDYVAKGLSGGEVIVYPPASAGYLAHDNVIAGNVIGYGATSGSIYISGVVGERFMVRNSGATAVVEGVGDHALEYMTGGTVCIIGETGRNFGAGFSGGTAYVYQLNKDNVNAQALTGGELLFTELSDDDAEIVHELLTKHVEKTSSVFAQTILQDFDNARSKFVKVLPRDYANVTRIRAEAAVSGLDPDGDEVWQQILEGTHG